MKIAKRRTARVCHRNAQPAPAAQPNWGYGLRQVGVIKGRSVWGVRGEATGAGVGFGAVMNNLIQRGAPSQWTYNTMTVRPALKPIVEQPRPRPD
jgi:hypothetical protein